MPDLFLELRDESGGGEQTPAPLPEDDALDLLRNAEFSASRLIPWGSNYSFAVALEAADGRTQLAIYKPRAGEAPLYDFPEGTLYLRELAAYLFSRWAGWDLVPPTVVRDGPHGIGSVQLYVQPDGERQDQPRLLEQPRPGHRTNGPVRPHRQQRRPEDQPLPAGRDRQSVGHRSRTDVQPRAEAADRPLAICRRTNLTAVATGTGGSAGSRRRAA